MPHWKVRFMRRGIEPPYPFGKQVHVVCARTQEEAKEQVPANQGYPITASQTNAPVDFTYYCSCGRR